MGSNKVHNSPPVDICKKGQALHIIYENEAPASVPAASKEQGRGTGTEQPDGTFKENMLLSFYNWPKVETSAVFSACIKNTIQSDGNSHNRY